MESVPARPYTPGTRLLEPNVRILLLLIPGLLLTGCATWFTAHSYGLVDGQLSDCPSPPRCLSSQASDPAHRVAPLAIRGDVSQAWAVAAQALAAWPQSELVAEHPGYLRVEVTSPWGFYTDDFELLLQADRRQIAVRSSGRIGYYDFNVNRDRIEALRAQLVSAGVVVPAAP